MILAIVSVAVFDPVQQRVASYILRSVAIILATLVTVLVIMIPKLYQVYKIPPGTEGSQVRRTTTNPPPPPPKKKTPTQTKS